MVLVNTKQCKIQPQNMQIVVNELLSLNRHPGVTVNVNIKNNNNNKNQLNVQARDWVCPLAQKPLLLVARKWKI